MSAKILAAELPAFRDPSSLGHRLRSVASSLVKRFTRAATSTERALVLEDRIALGPKKSLAVVRCHGRRFLVASAGDTVGPLIEVTPLKPPRRSGQEREA
jgi:flagellar biogenesis protein FliO